jgi:hexosaminidase
MAAIAAYPELCCTKDTSIKVNPGSKFSDWFGNGTFRMNVDNSLNPSDEKVYQFLDKVFTEVAQLFPAPYIHVGGDECYKGYWQKDPGCIALMEKLNIRHVEDLQGYFMNRVKDIIKAKGKKVIGWDEVMEGGMSNEATLMFWRGFYAKDILPKAQKGGYKIIMSPTTTNYFDYFQGERTIEPPVYANLRLKDVYTFEPVPAGMKEENILGGQANLWTENIQNFRHAQYMTFPRAWAISEILWVPKEKKKAWKEFVKAIEYQAVTAEKRGVKVAKSIYDPVVTYKKENGRLFVELASELPGVDLYYTLDESMPDRFSTLYKAGTPIVIPAEGAITLRIQAYRNGQPSGHFITIGSEFLKGKMK